MSDLYTTSATGMTRGKKALSKRPGDTAIQTSVPSDRLMKDRHKRGGLLSPQGKLIFYHLSAYTFVVAEPMNQQARTIKMLLLDGDPSGIRLVQMGDWTGEAIVIPRQRLKQTKARGECNQPALYFLLGLESEDSVLPTVYIGEAENLCDRLMSHEGTKDFWSLAIGFVGRGLNKAHVKYLESVCVRTAKNVEQCNLLNATTPQGPSLSEFDLADLARYLEGLKIVLPILGYNFLQEPTPQNTDPDASPLFECIGKGARASGRLTGQGFVVYKGSTATKKFSKAVEKSNSRIFEELSRGAYVKDHEDGLYLFTKDYVFKTPSSASDVIVGNASNGWDKWKTKDGRTLDGIYRKSDQ